MWLSTGAKELIALQRGPRRTKRNRLSRRFRQRLYWRDKGLCRLCEKPVPFKEATFDHVTPLCLGGRDRLKENIITAHRGCNQKKGELQLAELEDLAPDALAFEFYDTVKSTKEKKGHYRDWIAKVAPIR